MMKISAFDKVPVSAQFYLGKSLEENGSASALTLALSAKGEGIH